MNVQTLLSEVAEREVVALPATDLTRLLERAEVLQEVDTHFAGHLRILSLEEHLLVQEQLPEAGTLLLRGCGTREQAERFVERRLDAYERMWDGCGCKVNYFEPLSRSSRTPPESR
jgi:hypothetical protein